MGEKTAALLYETDAKVAEVASSSEVERDSDERVDCSSFRCGKMKAL